MEFKKRQNKIKKRKREEEENLETEHIVSASTLKNTRKLEKDLKDTNKKGNEDTEDFGLGPSFKSSGTAASLYENTATRTLDVDGHEIKEIQQQEGSEYKGLSAYKEYVNERKYNPTQKSAGGLRAGPLKGQSNIRISSRFDYAAGICKDYKETGFCGFGDSCVFMHDRSDYKQGWQLEQEWQEQLLQKQQLENYEIRQEEEEESEKDSEDDLPFCCFICRKDFTNPVVTNCRHYFCEKCALIQFKKTPKCFICGINTKGVFNHAKDLLLKLEKRNQRMKNRELELAIETSNQESGAED